MYCMTCAVSSWCFARLGCEHRPPHPSGEPPEPTLVPLLPSARHVLRQPASRSCFPRQHDSGSSKKKPAQDKLDTRKKPAQDKLDTIKPAQRLEPKWLEPKWPLMPPGNEWNLLSVKIMKTTLQAKDLRRWPNIILVHKFVPTLQAMKIPDAKAAVDQEWKKARDDPSMVIGEGQDKKKRKSTLPHWWTYVISRMRSENKNYKNTKAESCSVVTL